MSEHENINKEQGHIGSETHTTMNETLQHDKH